MRMALLCVYVYSVNALRDRTLLLHGKNQAIFYFCEAFSVISHFLLDIFHPTCYNKNVRTPQYFHQLSGVSAT